MLKPFSGLGKDSSPTILSSVLGHMYFLGTYIAIALRKFGSFC